jgi:hypothetical protein
MGMGVGMVVDNMVGKVEGMGCKDCTEKVENLVVCMGGCCLCSIEVVYWDLCVGRSSGWRKKGDVW